MTDDHPTETAPDETPIAVERRRWLDEPRNVDRIAYALYAACGLLFLIDLFVTKHGPFAVEHVFGFYAVFGFSAYVALVAAAEVLRRLVMRPEDYYDR